MKVDIQPCGDIEADFGINDLFYVPRATTIMQAALNSPILRQA